MAFALNAAHAQSQAAPQGENGAAEAVPGEIVVTAQKREQKLQDVGIAISVISKEELDHRTINNATDVVSAIPNLKYNAYSSSQVVFNMRGVSQNDYGDQQ